MTIETIVRDIPELAEWFALHVETAYREARAEGRALSIAVPGGSVAEAFFPRLVKLPVDWRHVVVFFVDERGVPPHAPDANALLARERWLDRVPIPMGNVHRMRGDARDLGAAAARYQREMTDALGDPLRLDIVLLGMGADGHVASLFPGSPALEEQERYVVAVSGAPKPPPRRLTLSLLGIARGVSVVLAAFGSEKAEAIREAVEDPGSRLPAALALRSGPIPFVLVDPEAAAGLGERAARR